LDLIIIFLGTNDMRPLFKASPSDSASGMLALVQLALDRSIHAPHAVPTILSAAPVPLGDDPEGLAPYPDLSQEAVSLRIR
jgi:lysophospholipase L1-like esterase